MVNPEISLDKRLPRAAAAAVEDEGAAGVGMGICSSGTGGAGGRLSSDSMISENS